jgi:hypothetical protein
MSGIIFNGQEMKKGENAEDYINRVVNNVINITIQNSEQKQLKHNVKVSDEDSSTDSDTTEEISETDEEENGRARRIYNNPLQKRVMLGTYNISMDKHDSIIDRFNSKYGTYERGSNGSIGHYFTHGETIYNLGKLFLLRQLYLNQVNEVNINGVKVSIGFLPVKEETKRETEEETRNLNTYNNFCYVRDFNKFITIESSRLFKFMMSQDVIRDYEARFKHLERHDIKPKAIIYYPNKINKNKFHCIYEIIKLNEKRVKCRELQPVLTIKYETFFIKNLMKYTRNEYMREKTYKYFSYSDLTHKGKLLLNDSNYFYYLFDYVKY